MSREAGAPRSGDASGASRRHDADAGTATHDGGRKEAATGATVTVRIADWARDEATLRALRHEVFVIEQHVPEAIEWDGIDVECRHALAEDSGGRAIGCGRLLPDGHIGRMAVLRPWRGRGVGTAILERLIGLARDEGHAKVVLNAQTHAMPFYARCGFTPCGAEFEEAGIAHLAMARKLR